jgi:hypothetical protein
VKSIAFPAISTGAYGFPLRQAACIAVRTVREYISSHPSVEQVVFVCHGEETYGIYREILEADTKDHPETSLAETLTAHLRMIEISHDIRIRNITEVVQRLVPALKNNTAALSAGILMNNWVAVNGITGDIIIPDDVVSRILEYLNEK